MRIVPFATILMLMLMPVTARAWILARAPGHRGRRVGRPPCCSSEDAGHHVGRGPHAGGEAGLREARGPGALPNTKFGEWDGICVDFASFPALAADHSCSADGTLG